MSVLDEQGTPPQPLPPAPRIEWTPPPNRRRQILRAFAVLLALALVGGGIGSLIYVHRYQPLGPGDTRFWRGPNLESITDGINGTGFIATGPTGSVSTIRMTIRNNGHFDVRLIGLERTEPLEESVSWYVLPDGPNASARLDDPSAYTSQPVTLHPGQTAGVAVDVVRPKCQPGEGMSVGGARLRWSALGVHHVYEMAYANALTPGAMFWPCYPKAALKHVQRF